jgi:ATP-binding protein involved in chromosome partitioning
MSMGLLVGEGQALVPDNFMTGLIVTRTLKDMVWGELDYLLLDLPPGTGEPQQTLLKTMAIDGVLIVTTRQQMALMDAERSANLFKKADVTVVGVVENMSYVVCPDCGKEIEVFPSAGAEGLLNREAPVLARLPMDAALSERVTAEHPLVTGAERKSAALFREIAKRVAEILPTRS